MAPDLLPLIPAAARSLLHVGCGDGSLGERIRQRQRCRVVGIETDRDTASTAKRRLDDVYLGELAHVVSILSETFDCIVADGVLEQTADPGSLLAELRRIASPGGTFVGSIPNLAHMRVIAGLLDGHFDAARQMRFFTRESAVELIDSAGWELERIETVTEAGAEDERLAAALRAGGVAIHDDLFVTWLIVVARRG